MPQNFLPCDRDQVMLLPPDLREWLPANHLARFVIELLDALDLAPFYGAYRADGHGRAAFDPGMMVGVLLYSYAVGVRSSRRIEARCVEDVATRVVAGNQQPDHVTIARFRKRHAAALNGLFDEVLGLCANAGLVQVGTIAIDGTKIRANASIGQNRSYRAIAEEILAEADRVDAEEDALYGDKRGDELPDEFADPSTRRARIREALRQLDEERAVKQAQARADYEQKVAERAERAARRGSPPPGRPPVAPERRKPRKPDQIERRNITDPDSRIVADHGRLVQGYNAQVAAGSNRVIVAVDVTAEANDSGELVSMTQRACTAIDRIDLKPPKTVLADGGYWDHEQIAQLTDQGIEVLVPPGGPKTGPGGSRAPRRGPEAERITTTLATADGQARYRQRAALVEPVFAEIKHHRQITGFLRRGLQAVRDEFTLIATTHNLRRLYFTAPQTA